MVSVEPPPAAEDVNAVTRSKSRPLAVALIAALSGGALAALPALKTQGKVEYLTGGIGKDESDSIKQVRATFPLALEFLAEATPRAEYLADIDVNVIDGEGRSLLIVRAEGPFLLARVPPGEYTVRATYMGHTLEKRLRVGEGGSGPAVFVWDARR